MSDNIVIFCARARKDITFIKLLIVLYLKQTHTHTRVCVAV